MTECKPKAIEFHALGSREVVSHFDGGDITSDGGGLMLREVEQRTGILKQFAACFAVHELEQSPGQTVIAQSVRMTALNREPVEVQFSAAVPIGCGEHAFDTPEEGMKADTWKSVWNRNAVEFGR